MNKLKELREAKKITQEAMAELLGYKDKSSYCLIENGKTNPSIPVAIKILNILDVDISEIGSIFKS